MSDKIEILYNDTCPVCRFEIDAYRKTAAVKDLPMRFDPLIRAADWGLTEDAAARRLHVRVAGQTLSGVAAFRAIWATLPGMRWASHIAGWPGVRQVLGLVYDHIAAPILYRAHLRRQARAAKAPRDS